MKTKTREILSRFIILVGIAIMVMSFTPLGSSYVLLLGIVIIFGGSLIALGVRF